MIPETAESSSTAILNQYNIKRANLSRADKETPAPLECEQDDWSETRSKEGDGRCLRILIEKVSGARSCGPERDELTGILEAAQRM